MSFFHHKIFFQLKRDFQKAKKSKRDFQKAIRKQSFHIIWYKNNMIS